MVYVDGDGQLHILDPNAESLYDAAPRHLAQVPVHPRRSVPIPTTSTSFERSLMGAYIMFRARGLRRG
jgi:hypothetical protein